MKIIFRTDANQKTGAGHAMRCLTIARTAIERGNEVIFAGDFAEFSWVRSSILDFGIKIEYRRFEHEYVNLFLTLNPSWVVIDSYEIPKKWYEEIANNFQTLCIVDSPINLDASVTYLDQNSDVWPLEYESDTSRYLLGIKYLIVRDTFIDCRHPFSASYVTRRRPKLLLVTGGSDLIGASIQFSKLLARSQIKAEITVITREEFHDPIRQLNSDEIEFKPVKPSKEISKYFARADLALSLGGTMAWELAASGVPSMVGFAVTNQKQVCANVEKLGIGVSLGEIWDSNFLKESNIRAVETFIDDFDSANEMKKQCIDLIDGDGKARVISFLENNHQ